MTVDKFCFPMVWSVSVSLNTKKKRKIENDYPHEGAELLFKYPSGRYKLVFGGKVIVTRRKNFVIFTIIFYYIELEG